jgi:hypothetical protein
MTLGAWAFWTIVPAITFAYGYWFGQADDRSKARAWCDGYQAGLAKSDEMWPTVVRRWEMDV